jgi:hypothetical protein
LPSVRSGLGLAAQLALVFAVSLAGLVGLIAWLENVHVITANGMFKALQALPWISDFRNARLDPSNYLYFPLYGGLSSLLDTFGVARGIAWKQFAYLNAFWVSIANVMVYAFAHRLSGSARVAALSALFHAGCGTVLLLSVINEDIMPGYALVLGSMLLAGLWFGRATHRQVIAVAVLFTIGWLMEWRLMFPTLAAFGLALLLADLPLKRRLALIGTLLISIVATAGIVQQAWEGHAGAMGLHDLLWTGKGVTSGWGGFGLDKFWMMLGGVGNYLMLVGSFPLPQDSRAAWLPLSLSVVVQAIVLTAAVAILWPRRHEPQVRAIAAVFIGTLGAGQVLNLYSQPHDPQMQVNVMPWLTVAWAAILSAALARPRPVMVALFAALSVAPLAANAVSLAQWRGGDTRAVAALQELERRFPTDRTVFLYWGFEPAIVWHYALWSQNWDWDGKVDIAPAPSDSPRFKWISVIADAVRRPASTGPQHAHYLKRDIDLAFSRGYDVIVSDVWAWSEAELTTALGPLSASARGPAIYAALHDEFAAERVFTDALGQTYYRLRPR